MKPNGQPLPLDSIVRQGRVTWRVGGVMLTGGERYYFLVDTKNENCTGLLPWFDIEPWAASPRAKANVLYQQNPMKGIL